MTFVLIAVFVLYASLVACLYVGWRKATKAQLEAPEHGQMISVIVPVRNEAGVIGSLLDDLFRQRFPTDRFEIIAVDDHSDDQTAKIIEEQSRANPLVKCATIKSGGYGKKSAIATGVQRASGNLIVTTDADCRMGSGWLSSIDAAFATKDIKMVFGPVKIETDHSFFSKVQAMEFSSLIGSGAATLALGVPSMCNGANLAFRKEIFLEVGGFDGNLHVASGDDEFLMRKIAGQYPHGISFNHAQDGIVVTQPQRSLSAFILQRLRWAGKWKYNQDLLSKLLALLIFGFHATVLSLPFFLFAGLLNAYVLVSLLVLKALVEFIFIRSVTAWLGARWHGLSFLFLQLLYPVYAVGIGLASWFVHPAWKGRK